MKKLNLVNEIASDRAFELVELRYQNKEKFLKAESQQLVSLIGDLFLDAEQFDSTLFKDISILALLDYLQNGHQLYLNKKLPEIQLRISNLMKEMGYSHPVAIVLARFLGDYKQSLLDHIYQEDTYVFPYITKLVHFQSRGGVIRPATFLNGWSSLAAFLMAHSDTERDLQELIQFLQSIAKESEHKNQINLLVTQLSLFELDLNVHAKIEDEVLIPKALQLEKSLQS